MAAVRPTVVADADRDPAMPDLAPGAIRDPCDPDAGDDDDE
jgi:hypothetical protein